MRRFLFLMAIILPGASCTKEEVSPRDYPRVDTGAITDVTDHGATFHGEITFSSVPVIDHGFVWSNERNDAPNLGDQISLGPGTGAGTFSATCDYALMKNRKYYVRAFAKSERHTVYGDVLTFDSRGAALPRLTGFAPKEGTWDDLITLTGENFSAIERNISVRFGNVDAFVIESGATYAIVKVPYQLAAMESDVSLTWDGHTSGATDKFVLKAPVIETIVPSSAAAGTDVSLNGQYLSGPTTRVFVNGIEAALKFASRNKVTFVVPTAMAGGAATVTIHTGHETLTGNIDFTVL